MKFSSDQQLRHSREISQQHSDDEACNCTKDYCIVEV